MHSALFVASIPPQRTDWGQFLAYSDAKLKNSKNTLRLAENIWLVNVTSSIAELGWLISISEQQGVPYGILPFEHAPEWLPGGFDPKTIQGRISP